MVSISLLAAEYAPSHSHTIIGAATARRALAHRLNRERPRPQDSSFPFRAKRYATRPRRRRSQDKWRLGAVVRHSGVTGRPTGICVAFRSGAAATLVPGSTRIVQPVFASIQESWPTPRDCVHPTSLCASCLRRGRSFWASRLSSCLSTSETVSTSTARSRPLSLPRAAGNSSMLPEFAHSHH